MNDDTIITLFGAVAGFAAVALGLRAANNYVARRDAETKAFGQIGDTLRDYKKRGKVVPITIGRA